MAGSEPNVLVGAPSLIKIGPYGTAKGSCTDVGYSRGGLTEEPARAYFEKRVDQQQGAIGVNLTDRDLVARVPIAQATLDNIRLAQDLSAGQLAGQVLSRGHSAANYVTVFIDGPAGSGGNRAVWYPKCILRTGGFSMVKDDETIVELEIFIIFDTAQAVGAEHGTCTDSSTDTTPPTVALTTPVDGGTVTKDAKGIVQWTITEVGNPIDENTVVYGNNDKATFAIYNVTTLTAVVLVAGAITYNAGTKVVTFTPDANWTASDKLMAVVNTNLRDLAGNHLADQKIEDFTVTA